MTDDSFSLRTRLGCTMRRNASQRTTWYRACIENDYLWTLNAHDETNFLCFFFFWVSILPGAVQRMRCRTFIMYFVVRLSSVIIVAIVLAYRIRHHFSCIRCVLAVLIDASSQPIKYIHITSTSMLSHEPSSHHQLNFRGSAKLSPS